MVAQPRKLWFSYRENPLLRPRNSRALSADYKYTKINKLSTSQLTSPQRSPALLSYEVLHPAAWRGLLSYFGHIWRRSGARITGHSRPSWRLSRYVRPESMEEIH